jgi:squalene synthase HpnD
VPEPAPSPSNGRAEVQAREAVHAIVADAHSSFYWALRFLPHDRREAIFAVYAFCRSVDDIADGPGTVDEKLVLLAEWRAEVQRLYAGARTRPITHALLAPVARFGLHRDDFLALVDGVTMDASGRMCAPSLLELELYCRRAAGAIGMLSTTIFGLRRPEGRSLALSLGQALQYVNFLRDLAEDAAQGRIYVHRELLEAKGITTRDPAAFLRDPHLPEVAAEMATMARARFRAARRVLKAVPRHLGRPARIMMATYETVLERLLARGFDPDALNCPVRLGPVERLWIALRAAF